MQSNPVIMNTQRTNSKVHYIRLFLDIYRSIVGTILTVRFSRVIVPEFVIMGFYYIYIYTYYF